jgi:hypothetical protein
MRLNQLQLRLLKRYSKFHVDNYHSSDLIVMHTRTWFLCSVGAVIAYWLTKSDYFDHLAWFAIGFFIAALIITIKSIRLFSKLWPVLDEVINWERVGVLLEPYTQKLEAAPQRSAKDQA